MTATIRVSEIKNPRAHGPLSKDGKPREGTKIRQAYDALRRGEVVSLKAMGVSPVILTDMYGMDIKSVPNDKGPGWLGTRLLGEWDGSYYVPIERIVSEEAESV